MVAAVVLLSDAAFFPARCPDEFQGGKIMKNRAFGRSRDVRFGMEEAWLSLDPSPSLNLFY